MITFISASKAAIAALLTIGAEILISSSTPLRVLEADPAFVKSFPVRKKHPSLQLLILSDIWLAPKSFLVKFSADIEHGVIGHEERDPLFVCEGDRLDLRPFALNEDDRLDVRNLRSADYLGVCQSGDQKRIGDRKGKDVAHEVRAVGLIDRYAHILFPREYLRAEGIFDFIQCHKG